MGELSAKAKKRLCHIISHLDGGFNEEVKINNIKNLSGNFSASSFGLSAHALASAMHCWFSKNDLHEFKNWLYISASLDRLYYKFQEINPSFGRGIPSLFSKIMSDNEEIIKFFCNYEFPYDVNRINDPANFDFLAYQSIFSLRGDWKSVETRSKMVLDNEKYTKKHVKNIPDFNFFLSLSRSDIAGMENAISIMLSSEEIQRRAKNESGYTQDLVATDIAVYLKLAWRNGYYINPKSSYIPEQWLPIQPLKNYDKKYDFLVD